MFLGSFDNSRFDRGRSRGLEICWMMVHETLISSPIPGSWLKVAILRLFGSCIGTGVCIKPRVRVKFPWRLSIGDDSWIGEGAWIDNLAQVQIGSNCCLSQGVYLCTGSHDWNSSGFDLIVKGITIHDHVWLGAFSRVAPGVVAGEGAVLTMGSTATQDMEPWTVYQGNPARPVSRRGKPC